MLSRKFHWLTPYFGCCPVYSSKLIGSLARKLFPALENSANTVLSRNFHWLTPYFGCCPVYSSKHWPDNFFQHWKTVLILCFLRNLYWLTPYFGCCAVYSPKPIWSLAQHYYPVVSQHWNTVLIQSFHRSTITRLCPVWVNVLSILFVDWFILMIWWALLSYLAAELLIKSSKYTTQQIIHCKYIHTS